MRKELKQILETIKQDKLNNDEAREYIEKISNWYNAQNNKLDFYSEDDYMPEVIIASYFTYIDRMDIDKIYEHFKMKYIYNENRLEEVHDIKEREGLGIAYDYIQEINDYSNLNVYELLKIHKKIYSLVDHPEFGGNIRVETAHLNDVGIDLVPAEAIPNQLQNLYLYSKELAKKGIEIASEENMDIEKLFEYINECIKFNCKLIKIHPFADGNGRSVRALLNLYFKIVGIPPVYIVHSEKQKYQDSMSKALRGDEYGAEYDTITKFYYYKIFDSIMELDIQKLDIKTK